MSFFDYIRIDEYSATPKYIQLTNSILAVIENGKLLKGELLPSINELSFELEISRDTAEKGYKNLKKLGVLGSVPGKGYYIINSGYKQRLKIFLLFNKLSAHKKIIYDAFITAIGEEAQVDFYIYHNDYRLFKKILAEKKEDYSYYVIIPHFNEGGENAHELINRLPKEKLVLLDKRLHFIDGEYASVYENFENDIYRALESAKIKLSKYHTITLIFPPHSYYPKEIINGFSRFCQEYAFNYNIIHEITKEELNVGVVYITVMEDDLVILIEKVMQQQLKIGEDIGIISYNETPLKKIILNGITTISTDFRQMGIMAADVILNNQKKHLEVPFNLTLRGSL